MSKTFDDFRGTISENLAINEFLRKGCVDIIVIHPNGKVELLDIKTRCIRKRDSSPIHRSLTEKQKRWGVKLYYIDENNQGHYHPPKGKNEK